VIISKEIWKEKFNIYVEYIVKEDEMGRACSKNGGE
jgi:hypothetical protein